MLSVFLLIVIALIHLPSDHVHDAFYVAHPAALDAAIQLVGWLQEHLTTQSVSSHSTNGVSANEMTMMLLM